MIKIACASGTIELFKSHVSKHFYNRTQERLRVENLREDLTNSRGQDFIVASEASLRRMIHKDPEAIIPLNGYKEFLAGCGGFGGISRPFIIAGGMVVGIELTAGNTHVPELPDFLEFLNDRRERFVLAATSRRVLKKRRNFDFFYLATVILSIQHFMPMIEAFEAQQRIRLGTRTRISPRDKRVQVSDVKIVRRKRIATFTLSFTNLGDKLIRRLDVFFFNSNPRALKNAHGLIRFSSRVNRVGPVAGYHFGALLPGDTISRAIAYDLSFGNELAIAWNPAQAARMNDGGGWGNGCSTTKPDPIPDPFPGGGGSPAFAVEGCYDAGCANSHCPPHVCKVEGEECGCFRAE